MGHADLEPGLENGRLAAVGGGRPLHPRLGLDHLQVDGDRKFDPDGPVLVELHQDLGIWNQVVDRLPEILPGDGDLVVGVGVHEMELVPGGVKELHLVLLQVRLLNTILRAKAVLEAVPGLQVAELGLHHAAPVSGCDVLNAQDAAQVSFVKDRHAGTQLCRLDHRSVLRLGCRCRGRESFGPADYTGRAAGLQAASGAPCAKAGGRR